MHLGSKARAQNDHSIQVNVASHRLLKAESSDKIILVASPITSNCIS